MVSPNAAQVTFAMPLFVKKQIMADEAGTYMLTLVAAIDQAGEKREAKKTVVFQVA